MFFDSENFMLKGLGDCETLGYPIKIFPFKK